MVTETFTCPACGAPQEAPTQAGQSSVRCPYCGHTVIVPDELRIPEEIEHPEPQSELPVELIVDVASAIPAAASSLNDTVRRLISCVVILAILLAIGTILVVPLARMLGDNAEQVVTMLPVEMTLPAIATESSFATLDLAIGREGIGPGQFMDLRHVAVDGEGRIYTGQQDGGRIQVFDQAGQFLTQWMIEDELPLASMSVSRDGKVYIVFGGEVYLHDGLTGELLGKWNYEDGFDDVFATLDDGLLVSHGGTEDNILRFNADENLELSIPAAISGQTGDSELSMSVAEDGAGNIYALGAFNNAVFLYDSQGKYLNRMGSQGNEPGQFQAAHDIVIDGQGRIYVSDIKGVQVFQSDGRYLGVIDIDGSAFGLAIDDQDNLYVAARTRVYRYKLP
jgi:hypothetical protein